MVDVQVFALFIFFFYQYFTGINGSTGVNIQYTYAAYVVISDWFPLINDTYFRSTDL